MHDAPLTQHAIDSGMGTSDNHGSGLYAKLARHPYLVGGAMLASAGVAFAAAKLAMDHSNNGSEAMSKHTSAPRTTKRRATRAAKPSVKRRSPKQH
jgi:hypothetical protein